MRQCSAILLNTMHSYTRRNLLRFTSAGLLSLASNPSARAHSPSANTPRSGEVAVGQISVRITAGAKRFAPAPALVWRPATASSADSITLDPAQSSQDILGFGAAFTDAACYTLNQLSPTAREELFQELFHPSKMGLGVCRLCIGSSDYSLKIYSYDDGDPDPELTRFSVDHDRAYIIPMLKACS